jgi:hypothetical protein
MIQLTPEGQQAADIASWAWEDPAGRVDEAIRQVGALAQTLPDGKALMQVQDAGTMLARLKGTVGQPEVTTEQHAPRFTWGESDLDFS